MKKLLGVAEEFFCIQIDAYGLVFQAAQAGTVFGIELLELGDVLVVEEYENFAFGGPEVSLLASAFELAFLEGNVAIGEVSATCLGAESEFILAVAVVVGALDGIPAVTGLEDDADGLAGAGIGE